MLATAFLTTSSTATLAAKGDRQKAPRDDGETGTAAAAVITSVPGDRLRMAKAKVAQRITRIADAAGDQVTRDGTPALEAPAHADLEAVYLAPIRVPRKLLTRMEDDYPRGAAGAYYGQDADWSKLDRALFVAVDLADERPQGVVQQVEVGLDGDAAGPLQVGSADDTRAGVERFSLSGVFSNGAQTSGTTDISGRGPDDPIDYYNAASEVFGFYDERAARYYVVMPMTGETEAATVALRTMTESGEVVDRLELPAGGHLVPIAEPAAGFDASAGAPLACRSIETFTAASGVVALDDPGATVIRYTAGLDPALPASEAAAALAALDAFDTTVPLTLHDLDADEATRVEAQLARAPALNAFTLTMEVPAGRWTFAPVDAEALLTPAGEGLIEPATLIGRAGVLTGEGLDGLVSGDASCARWDVSTTACQLVPPGEMAALVGLGSADVEQTTVARADGSAWCVGIVPATGEPQYIVRIGNGYATPDQLGGAGSASSCQHQPLDVGTAGLTLDCGAEGFENHSFVVVPEVTASADPTGGLLVSIDMLVDGDLPFGQRYDSSAAAALFQDLASDLATGVRPVGALLATTLPADASASGDADRP